MIKGFSSESHCFNILETIDFFSQVLHPEQLEEYGYQYVHQLLQLESSVIYMGQEKEKGFALKGMLNVEGALPFFERTHLIDELATKVGVVLHGDLTRYLPKAILEAYPATLLMPLIVAEELIGIILGTGWQGQSPEDFTFAEAVKKMINNAFYTGIQMTESRSFKVQMDRKFYDQMLLHQIVRVMLSQLDMEQLIKICVDGIRELTASAKTGFFLRDERSGKLQLRHFEDLITFKKHFEALWLDFDAKGHKIVYQVKEDEDVLVELFGEGILHTCAALEAHYLVLLKSDPIIGFVTLGPTVGEQVYTESTLEMVESIMGTVCIAIENVKAHMALQQQHEQLQETLRAMKDMSASLHIISSASDLNELCALTIQNLNIQAGFGECFIAIREKHGFRIVSATASEKEGEYFSLTDRALGELQSGFIMDFDCLSLQNYIQNDWQGQSLIFPIQLGEAEFFDECEGLVVCSYFSHSLRQYEVRYAEMLIKGIAGLFKQLGSRLRTSQVENTKTLFLAQLEKYDHDRDAFWMNYRVYYRYQAFSFSENLSTDSQEIKGYQFGTYEFVLVYEEQFFNEAMFEGYFEGTVEEIIEKMEMLINRGGNADRPIYQSL